MLRSDTEGSNGRAPESPSLLVTAREAGQILGVSRTTVYELIAAGELETVHIGRSMRLPVDTLDDYVERLRRRHAS